MSPINYEALRGETDASAQTPADGSHQATLDRAKLVDTNNGERLVTEWTTADGKCSWSSWNRFDQTGLSYTRELLSGLGIDLSKVADDYTFQNLLDDQVGHTFDVRTSSQKGSQGDRVFVSTYVDGRSQGVQTDVPIDTGGLPAAKDDEEPLPF